MARQEIEQSSNDSQHVYRDEREPVNSKPSNEYVLNVAFFSFITFVLVQSVFALIANSQSMLADSEAMAVDALTYLFNLYAERVKNGPPTKNELRLTPAVRAYTRELRRLYLELVPPSISVATLVVITVMTLMEAFKSLFGKTEEIGDDVSIRIMFLFSSANLLLDVVNVTCFARANSTFGLDVVREENRTIRESMTPGGLATETTRLVSVELDLQRMPAGQATDRGNYGSPSERNGTDSHRIVNLNMCSAWTVSLSDHDKGTAVRRTLFGSSVLPSVASKHVCADTLRSLAVLVASAIATAVPSVDGATADSSAAVAVSIVILISLIPLVQGIVLTAIKINVLHHNRVTEG
jgi:Co/Zn/Cd efflux system component